MTLDKHTLTRIHVHTLTVINIDNLESAESLDLYEFFLLEMFTNNLEHRRYEGYCITLVKLLTLYQHIGQIIYRYLSHYSAPPFFTRSFQLIFGLNVSTSLGGTSIR